MRIGILWGIWPEASAQFYCDIIRKLKKSWTIKGNKDFPNIIINSINATELLNHNTYDIGEYIQWVALLAECKVDMIAMVCNTIHIYRDEIIKETWFKNIIDLKSLLQKKIGNTEEVCILWTGHNISSNLYQFDKIQYTQTPKEIINATNKAIYAFNKWSKCTQERKILREYILRKKQTYILWCTEVLWIIGRSFLTKNNVSYIDTMELLSNHIISLYKKYNQSNQ